MFLFFFLISILIIITFILLIFLQEPVIPLTFPCSDIIPLRLYERPEWNVNNNYWGLKQSKNFSQRLI